MSSPPKKFFISRAGEDAHRAQQIAQILEDAGHQTFIQDWDILPGHSFPDRITEGLRGCTHVIAVISPHYVSKPYTLSEVYAAWTVDPLGRDRHTIPVKIENTERHPLLRQLVEINLVGLDPSTARRTLLDGIADTRPRQAPDAAHRIFIGKLPATDPTLIGRDDELATLDAAWANPKTNFLQIIAPGGTGKTALMTKWYKRHVGQATIFGWSFYSQGSSVDRNVSSDPFFADALQFFDIKVEPTASIYTKAERLASRMREERVLLILDGMEPLQEPSGGLKDSALKVLLEELSVHNRGLVLCTTRVRLTDVPDDAPADQSLDLNNLTPEDGARYLRHLNVEGQDDELLKASNDFGNHALALTLLGNYVADFLDGDIRRRADIKDLGVKDNKPGNHARKVMQGYERMFAGMPEASILRALGYFDHPAEPDALKLVLPGMSVTEYRAALNRLYRARLVLTKTPDQPIDCHPLVREHFGSVAKRDDREAYEKGHSTLYEYYSKQAPEFPDTLEQMTPLFHTIRHGCQAGRHPEALEDIYYNRIRRGTEAYLIHKLGAFATNLSLLAHFFEEPWSTPVPTLTSAAQSWVISSAAFALRALGRLADAVEPMRAGAEAAVEQGDWTNAAIRYSNLSELQLILGRIKDSVASARRSIEYADQSGEAFQRMSKRCTLAHALHQSGQYAESAAVFQEAEKIEGESHPEAPFLSSLSGYRYCDLLLSRGEPSESIRRVTRAVKYSNRLLDIGLDHVTLGRAHPPGSPEATQHLSQAVDFVRRSGQLAHLPLALLARATDPDLAETYSIATRSGMLLFLTDHHLAMARRHNSKDHFEKAAQLIQQTGYHRRDPELEELRKEFTAT